MADIFKAGSRFMNTVHHTSPQIIPWTWPGSIAQRAGDQCQVIDEILLANSNTQEMMNEINRRYQGRCGVVHPDPSGVARKTSAPVGKTDFRIIDEAGWPVYPAKQYKLVDRINTVNSKLRDAQ